MALNRYVIAYAQTKLLELLVLVLLITLPSAASAQKKGKDKKPVIAMRLCEAEVFYSWKRIPPEKKSGMKEMKTDSSQMYAPVEVFFTRVAETAAEEEFAKERLSAKLATVQGQAREYCKRIHENQAGCLAKRLQGNSDYRSFDFAARRAFLDAMKSDCERQSGICLTTRASDVTCSDDRSPEVPAMKKEEEAAEGEDAEKDSKKDKKKKKK